MYVAPGEIAAETWQAMTYGYLPAGQVFDWHSHENIEEVMLVLKVQERSAIATVLTPYAEGDLFRFPADVEHRIDNLSDFENEFVFVRVTRH